MKKDNGNINCFSDLIVAASKGGFTQTLKKKKKKKTPLEHNELILFR